MNEKSSSGYCNGLLEDSYFLSYNKINLLIFPYSGYFIVMVF